jgi:hypothetical protein
VFLVFLYFKRKLIYFSVNGAQLREPKLSKTPQTASQKTYEYNNRIKQPRDYDKLIVPLSLKTTAQEVKKSKNPRHEQGGYLLIHISLALNASKFPIL